MAQHDKIMAFRIVQVAIENFNMQPQSIEENNELGINTSYSFQVSFERKCVRCISSFIFKKDGNSLLELVLSCVFAIKPEVFESLYDDKREHLTIGAEFCRYMATIAVGAARGAIAVKTENTPLAAIVLPPINLVEAIKGDTVFTVE